MHTIVTSKNERWPRLVWLILCITLAYLLVLPGSRARIVRCGGRYDPQLVKRSSEWVSECVSLPWTQHQQYWCKCSFLWKRELKCLQITTLTVSTTTSGWLLDTTSTIISKSNSYVTWKWWISWQKAEWCQCQRIKAGDPVRSRCFRRSIGLCENRKTGERLDQLRLLRGEGLGR